MGRLVEIKVWKEIVVPLFVCLTLSVGNGYAQSESMVSSTDDVPLLERMTDGKRKVDWADMNIQFCSAADVSLIMQNWMKQHLRYIVSVWRC